MLAATFKLVYKKVIIAKWWELLWWAITALFLIMQVGNFFYDLIKGIIDAIQLGLNTVDGKSLFIINFLQLLFIGFIFSSAVIWYYAYYYPKLKNRLIKNPELQVQLDHTFKHLVVDVQPENIDDAIKLQNLEKIN